MHLIFILSCQPVLSFIKLGLVYEVLYDLNTALYALTVFLSYQCQISNSLDVNGFKLYLC